MGATDPEKRSALVAVLVIASPVLLARWAARRAYARLDGGSDSSEA